MSVAFERSMAARAHLQAGFTLVELIIAALVVALVMSAVLASASLAQATYRVHAEAADMDQRTRVLVHALQHDLALAGAGLDQGPLAGALTESFVPILPRAIGTDGPEAATASAITVRYVPAGSPQTTILDDLAGGASAVRVATDGVCPAADPVCGFSAGMQVAVFDGSGAYDLLTIADVQGGALRFRAPTEGAILPLAAGAAITAVVSRSYYLNESEARVYRYDGFQSRRPAGRQHRSARLRVSRRARPSDRAPKRLGSDRTLDDIWSAATASGRVQSDARLRRQARAARSSSATGSTRRASITGSGHCRQVRSCPSGSNGWATARGVPDARLAQVFRWPGRFDADVLRIRSVRVTFECRRQARSCAASIHPAACCSCIPAPPAPHRLICRIGR